jgi:hypothetical protein
MTQTSHQDEHGSAQYGQERDDFRERRARALALDPYSPSAPIQAPDAEHSRGQELDPYSPLARS